MDLATLERKVVLNKKLLLCKWNTLLNTSSEAFLHTG
jgi:hypothetical protein